MKLLLILCGVIVAVILFANVSPSRGDGEAIVGGQQTSGPQPYELGPDPIAYELQPTEEQDNIDRVAERLETDQRAASHAAWARAADQSLVAAQAEIASRQIGLEGIEDQGVVP